MKQIILAVLLMSSFMLDAQDTNLTQAPDSNVKAAESSIVWTGKKVTGQHTGTINIKSGNIDIQDGVLKGGNFVIDMNSIVCTDMEGEYGKKLEGHLKSDDFFGVPNHPTAEVVITSVNTGEVRNRYDITADLTIKGITHPITFSAILGEDMAKAKITVDRTKYDVKYGSGSFFDGLGDKMIYDDFELDLTVKF